MSRPSPLEPLLEPLEEVPPELRPLEVSLRRAFQPMDARALGLAIGIMLALVIAGLTLASPLVDPERRFPLALLREYFIGYHVSPTGAVIGAVWAFGIGLVGGWLLGALRNTVLSLWLLKARVRADLDASQDVLDHI